MQSREDLERRLAEALASLAKLPRGSVAHCDAQSAVRHLQRLVLTDGEMPATVDPRAVRRRG